MTTLLRRPTRPAATPRPAATRRPAATPRPAAMLRTGLAGVVAAVLVAAPAGLLAGCAAGPAPGAPAVGAVGADAVRPDDRQRLLDRWRARARVPAVTLAVAGPGERRFVAASGTEHRDGDVPVTPDAQFRIASITKTFVATVVLQLVEEGRLDLSDPLTDYVPDAPSGRGVTIGQLLGHTSGIPDYARADGYLKDVLAHRERRWSDDDVLGLVDGARRDFPPGTDYSYSNTGYVLLGRVVEAVTGSSWAAQVRRRILDPLRLEHTFVAGFEPVPGGVLPGYIDVDQDGDQDQSETGRPWPALETSEGAAGAMVSTAGDLASFGAALFQGRLVEPATLRQMTTIGRHATRTSGYGLGVEMVRPDYRLTLWGHGGFTIGFKAGLWYAPDRDLVVAVLANDARALPADLAELVVRGAR